MNIQTERPTQEASAAATGFTQWAQALSVANGDTIHAGHVYKGMWPRSVYLPHIEKAAVAAGTVTDADWAKPLAELKPLADGFITLLRPKTLLGRIPGVVPAPFNVKVPRQKSSGTASWVEEGTPTPVSGLTLDQVSLGISKLATISVITDELARSSDPAATQIVRASLIADIAEGADLAFLDPTITATAAHPASITNAATVIASAGTEEGITELQVNQLISVLADANNLASPVFITTPKIALHLTTLRDTAGRVFPNITVIGGNILGIPVLTSTAAVDKIILLDGSQLLVADGGITLDASNQASIQMDNAPANPPVASTTIVSLFQANLRATRAIRFLRWTMRRPSAVAYISGYVVGEA